MKRRRLILLGACVLVAAGVVALWPRHPKDPVYQGKKLSEWILEVNRNTNEAAIQEASDAIHAIGAEALPYLLRELAAHESKLAIALDRWMSEKISIELGFREGDIRRQKAAYGISLLGTNAAPALPLLASYLGDPERSYLAASAMSGCGGLALPYLRDACASTNIGAAAGGLRGLTLIAPETPAAIPPLIQMTRHPDFRIRVAAITAMGRARSRLDLVIPALTNLLSDPDSEVQIKVMRVLIKFGEASKPAVPHLLQLLQSPASETAGWASNALHQIDPSSLPRAAAP